MQQDSDKNNNTVLCYGYVPVIADLQTSITLAGRKRLYVDDEEITLSKHKQGEENRIHDIFIFDTSLAKNEKAFLKFRSCTLYLLNKKVWLKNKKLIRVQKNIKIQHLTKDDFHEPMFNEIPLDERTYYNPWAALEKLENNSSRSLFSWSIPKDAILILLLSDDFVDNNFKEHFFFQANNIIVFDKAFEQFLITEKGNDPFLGKHFSTTNKNYTGSIQFVFGNKFSIQDSSFSIQKYKNHLQKNFATNKKRCIYISKNPEEPIELYIYSIINKTRQTERIDCLNTHVTVIKDDRMMIQNHSHNSEQPEIVRQNTEKHNEEKKETNTNLNKNNKNCSGYLLYYVVPTAIIVGILIFLYKSYFAKHSVKL